MSLIRKILGMKDLSAEFDIPEVSINKKSISKEKKSEKPVPQPDKSSPPPPRQQPKSDAFGPVSNPMPSFNKTELDWIRKISVAKKTISKSDIVSQVRKARVTGISNNRILELVEYVYKNNL
jgi:hypothetical protein